MCMLKYLYCDIYLVIFVMCTWVHVDIHVKCLLFVSDFTKIGIFLADFYRTGQYQIS